MIQSLPSIYEEIFKQVFIFGKDERVGQILLQNQS